MTGPAPRTALDTIPVLPRLPGARLTLGPIQIADDAEGELQVLIDVDPTDYVVTTKRVLADLYREVEGGWQHQLSNRPDGWVGGPYRDDDGTDNPVPIVLATDVRRFRGGQVKAELEAERSLLFGARLELVSNKTR